MSESCSKCNQPIRYKAAAYQRAGTWRHRICPKRPAERGTKKKRRLSRVKAKADLAATRAAEFSNPESYVTRDGRWITKGEDWKRQVRRCYERDKGICRAELLLPEHRQHALTGFADVHHVAWRSRSGRNDSLSNLLLICREAHDQIHGRTVRWLPKG